MRKLLLVLVGGILAAGSLPAFAQEAQTKPSSEPASSPEPAPPPAPPGPQLNVGEIRYVGGNGDATVDPGERLQVFVSLTNSGSKPATDVRASIAIADTYITVLENTATWSDIAAGATVRSTQPFVIQAAPDAPRNGGCSFGGGNVRPVDNTSTAETGAPTAGEGSRSATTGGTATSSDGTVSSPPDSSPSEIPPGETPPADNTSPVGFDAKMTITASGQTFDSGFGTRVMCAAGGLNPGTGGGVKPGSTGGASNPGGTGTKGAPVPLAEDAASRSSTGRATAAGFAAALLAAATALLIRTMLHRRVLNA